MNAGNPRSLLHYLLTVLLGIGGLLLLDTEATYAPERSLIGDQTAVWADDWTSVNDPEAPVPRRPEAPFDPGYHPLCASIPCQPPLATLPSSHNARAPPFS